MPQCVECYGKTGHNIEYVLKLAEWARATFPEVEDEHLYGLEALIRQKAKKRGLVLENMGWTPYSGVMTHEFHLSNVIFN